MVDKDQSTIDVSPLLTRGDRWASPDQVLAWGRELLRGRWRVLARQSTEGRLALLLGAPLRPLTLGEQQVLSAFVEGFSCKRIALELGLARSTVSQRLASATITLGFATRVELLSCTARALAAVQSAACRDDGAVNARELDRGGERVLLFLFRTAEAPLPTLTRAEREVVHGVLAGKSNAAIAAARGASPHTVANQLAKIYRKLKVGSRWELLTRFPQLEAIATV